MNRWTKLYNQLLQERYTAWTLPSQCGYKIIIYNCKRWRGWSIWLLWCYQKWMQAFSFNLYLFKWAMVVNLHGITNTETMTMHNYNEITKHKDRHLAYARSIFPIHLCDMCKEWGNSFQYCGERNCTDGNGFLLIILSSLPFTFLLVSTR